MTSSNSKIPGMMLCIEENESQIINKQNKIDTRLYIEYTTDSYSNAIYAVYGMRQQIIRRNGGVIDFKPYKYVFYTKKALKLFVRYVIPDYNSINFILYSVEIPTDVGVYNHLTFHDFDVQRKKENEIVAYDGITRDDNNYNLSDILKLLKWVH